MKVVASILAALGILALGTTAAIADEANKTETKVEVNATKADTNATAAEANKTEEKAAEANTTK